MWKNFENSLKNAENLAFWWRDDDVRVKTTPFKLGYLKYKFKTKGLMKLLYKYAIPAIWAIVPNNYEKYGKFFTKNIIKYNQFATIHGIYHVNNSQNLQKSEFPECCNIEENYNTIIQNYNSFKILFNNNLLPVFVAPYNNMCEELKEKLVEYGLIISELNRNQKNHSNYNVDYDFVNWETYKLKNYNLILKELIELINSGMNVIGLNSHHPILTNDNIKFYEKLFQTISKYHNVKWINPFILV